MQVEKKILLIEDDQIDQLTIQRAFQDAQIDTVIDIVNNGEEALKYLQDNQKNPPWIILLDINMPRMNGIEFLKIVKSHAMYRTIPVIVMTTSKDSSDKVSSFSLGAAGYIIKSVDYLKFVETVRLINNYWILSEKTC